MTSAAAMYDPTHREQALHIRAKLAEELETLKLLDHALKARPDHDFHERTRPDVIAVAIEHVEAAMAALEMATRPLQPPSAPI